MITNSIFLRITAFSFCNITTQLIVCFHMVNCNVISFNRSSLTYSFLKNAMSESSMIRFGNHWSKCQQNSPDMYIHMLVSSCKNKNKILNSTIISVFLQFLKSIVIYYLLLVGKTLTIIHAFFNQLSC